MRVEMQNKSHRYGINSPMLRHGPIYTTYKMCISMMMIACMY